MKYIDTKGNHINSFEDWKTNVFQSSKKENHWKKGRSAYELADFMMNCNGEVVILKIIEDLLKEKLSLERATPELEIRFDKYGHGREHDLGIWGITDSKKTVFVGLEAKVDESFNEKISDVYIIAKTNELNGIKTNSAKRIEELLKRNFKEISPKLFDLRYQLLYSTVGTLDATNGKLKADISILLTIVFKTELYNEVKGIENYKDYIQFVNSTESERIDYKSNIDFHKIRIGDSSLYSIYMQCDKS